MEVVWATKHWPNCVFAFLLGVTEVSVNLAATYFGGQPQMRQIEFQKLLENTLIVITMNKPIRHLKRSKNNGKWAIASSCCPRANNSQAHKSSQQRDNIPSTNAKHAPEGCAPIAYAPQESIGVWNALVTPCLQQKHSFNTRLISTKKWQNMGGLYLTTYQKLV